MIPIVEYENLGKLNRPFEEAYSAWFNRFIASGWYVLGNEVCRFEQNYAAYCGSNHCIGVASGLDALMLGLRVHDFPAGSEVIVPSNTYIATILAIVQCGLKPVLVEPDIRTYNIDPKRIEEKITARTCAIMVVHLYGKSCAMGAVMAIAQQHNLVVVEDCAQAHGARFDGQMVGTFGIGAHSFYPTKNLGALGDGGAITTDSDLLAEKFRALRNYGSHVKYHNEYLGYNSRLDELQAGFLSIKLQSLDRIIAHKRNLAGLYHAGLKDDFIKPHVSANCFDVYHIYNIRHPRRDELKSYLLEQGIKTDIHYPIAPHRQNAMKGILFGEYPLADEIHRTTLSLPISFYHTEREIYRVIEVMNRF